MIEFGRFAAESRKRRGLGKPETFTFLGFTFICSKTRRGKFQIKRKSRRDRMRAKLQAIKQELRRSMHQPIPKQGRWLQQVVTGYFNYHAVPTNSSSLSAFLSHVTNLWRRTLKCAEPKRWDDLGADQAVGRTLAPETANPSSVARETLRRQTPEVGAVCPNWARTDLCGGREVTRVPTAKVSCTRSSDAHEP